MPSIELAHDGRRVVRPSVLPLVVMGGLAYLLCFVVLADMCTGTGPGAYVAVLICRPEVQYLFWGDLLVGSTVIAVVWIAGDSAKHIGVVRVLFLGHLFILRFMLLWYMARTDLSFVGCFLYV